jgi:murein DD-endopeptidase MepM/ murein hydrolase activator NlpD
MVWLGLNLLMLVPAPLAVAALTPGAAMLITDRRLREDEGFLEANVQRFLDRQPGPLKTYIEVFPNKVRQSAARSIVDSSLMGGINPSVILALLELKSKLLSNPNASQSDLDFALGFDKPYQHGFQNQIELTVHTLDQSWNGYPDSRLLKFKDDSTLSHAAPNRGTFAIQVFLAATSDQATWQKQVALGAGSFSFYTVYNQWFGDPLAAAAYPPINLPITPFLSRPFYDAHLEGAGFAYGRKNCSDGLNYNSPSDYGVNSFFDHEYPTYAAAPNDTDGTVVPYRGVRVEESCRWYSGHDGIDFNLPTRAVIAAANGRVLTYGYSYSCGYNVILVHPAFQNYRTVYQHLVSTPAKLEAGSSVTAGQMLGTDGYVDSQNNDPNHVSCSTGPHLHFGVRNPQNVSIDPYGFCPTSTIAQDPWELRSRAASYWLWQDNSSPCTQQHASSLGKTITIQKSLKAQSGGVATLLKLNFYYLAAYIKR